MNDNRDGRTGHADRHADHIIASPVNAAPCCARHAAGMPRDVAPYRCGVLSRADLSALAGAAEEVLRMRCGHGHPERTVLVLAQELSRLLTAIDRLDRAWEDAPIMPSSVRAVIDAARGM